MVDEYTVEDLNPKSQPVKSIELTVIRALQLIEAFDLLEAGQDWVDVPSATYRKILGDRYEHSLLLSECWNRYQRGTLHGEVQRLAANLPCAVLERKEIADGLTRINSRSDSGRKGRPTKPTPRQRPRRKRLG